MNNQMYNGWYNYETWLVNLWWDDCFAEDAQSEYDNSEDEYNSEGKIIFTRKERATIELAETIQRYVEEDLGPFFEENEFGFLTDAINATLSAVNWYEIAKTYMEDVEEESEEEYDN